MKTNRLFLKGLFLYNIKRLFFVPLLYFLYLLFSGAIPLKMTMMDIAENLSPEDSYWAIKHLSYFIARMADPGNMMIISIICAVSLSLYMYKMRSCVAIHALPTTREALHFTNIITGLLMIITPVLINAVILVGVCAPYSDMLYPCIGTSLALSVLFCLFFFGLAQFSCMASGNVLGAVVIYAIFNVIQAGILLTLEILAMPFMWGVDYRPWYYLSPVIKLEAFYSDWVLNASLVPLYVWLCALAGIVLLVISMLFYKRKNIESAGSLLPMAFTRPIFRWGISFAVASLVIAMFNFSEDLLSSMDTSLGIMIVCFVIVAPIVFFLVQMLIKKSFRIFNKRLVSECIVMVAVFIVIAFGIRYDITGIKKHIPKASQVEMVSITSGSATYEFTGSDIDTIIGIHKKIVEGEEELKKLPEDLESYDSVGYMYLTIDYNLKNGNSVRRDYNYEYTPDEDLKYAIATEIMDIFNDKERMVNFLFDEKDAKGKLYSINLYRVDDNGRDWEGHYNQDEELNALKDAFIKDIEGGNFKIVNFTFQDYAGYVSFEYLYKNEEEFKDNRFFNISSDCKNFLDAVAAIKP